MKLIIELAPARIEFDVATMEEGNALLQSESAGMREFFSTCSGLMVTDTAEPGEAPKTRTPRTPRTPKNQPDPTTAVAPPPITLQADAPAIPAFLDASKRAAPPPPLPASPPMAPMAPPPPLPTDAPKFALGTKVAAELKRRAVGQADGGKALADWFASTGLIAAGASFEKVVSVAQFTVDEKMAPVANLLGVV